MDDDHHNKKVSLEDVEIEKDTTDFTMQQAEPEKIQNDGPLILIQCLCNINSNNKKTRKTQLCIKNGYVCGVYAS